MDSKTLKISYSSEGLEKITQQLRELERQAKTLQQAFQKITIGAAEKPLGKLADSIKEATQAQQQFNDKFKQFQQMASQASSGGYGGGYNSNLGYGAVPSSQRGFSAGTDTSPYAAGPRGINWGRVAKIGGGIAIAGGALAGAVSFGSNAWADSQKLQIHEKMAGIQNYASAQSFRNQLYQEAVSSPIGFVGIKRAQAYALRNRESDRAKTDELGRLSGSDGTIATTPEEMLLKTTNMSAEAKLQEREASHFSMKNLSEYGKAILKVGGGGVAVAGAIAGTIGTGGLGAGLGVALGGAGVGAIVSGLKDIKDTYVQVADKQIEANAGALEATQSAIAAKTNELQNQMMNPAIAHIMSTFQGAAPMMIAGARATQGKYSYGMFSGYGLSPGEEIGLAGGLTSEFGAARAMGRGGLAQQAAGAMAIGFQNPGQMLGKINAAGGDEKATFTRLMAEGVKRGLEGSIQFIERLGDTIADASYSRQSGSTLGGVLAGGIFGGLTSKSTVNDILENQSAGKIDRDIFQGNAYFETRGLADAIGIGRGMGIDMNATQAGALGKSTIEELAANKSDRLDALFGDKSKDIRQKMLSTRIERLGAIIGSGDQGLQKEIESAGGFDAYLKSLAGSGGSTDKLAAVAGQVLGNEDFGGLRGYFRVLGGRGELGAGGGGRLKGVLPGLATASQSMGIERTSETIGKMKGTIEENRAALEQQVMNDPELQKRLGVSVQDGKLSRPLSTTELYRAAEGANRQQREMAASADGYGSTEKLVQGLVKAAGAIDVFADKLLKIAQSPTMDRAAARFQTK